MVRHIQATVGKSSGLRTRYFPKNRIGHGVISMAPWLDVVFLVLCFIILDSKFIFQQGMVVNLPVSSSRDSLLTEMVAIVRAVETGDASKRREIVFFDDSCFQVNNDEQMKMLKQAFVEYVVRHAESGMIIYVDTDVRQGTLAKLFDMAREAGVVQVNIAARPEVSSE